MAELRRDGFDIFCDEPEGSWLYETLPAIPTVDKYVITANGIDTATVTAEVHPDLVKVTFYHADTDEVIAIVVVDPAINTATLEVTATTPGTIWIRLGEPTRTRLNEVVINAT